MCSFLFLEFEVFRYMEGCELQGVTIRQEEETTNTLALFDFDFILF